MMLGLSGEKECCNRSTVANDQHSTMTSGYKHNRVSMPRILQITNQTNEYWFDAIHIGVTQYSGI